MNFCATQIAEDFWTGQYFGNHASFFVRMLLWKSVVPWTL